MITLNRKQLKALAESGHTRETLEDLYSWKQGRGITYSESLQLLAHEEGDPLQQGLLKVPRCVGGGQRRATRAPHGMESPHHPRRWECVPDYLRVGAGEGSQKRVQVLLGEGVTWKSG